MSKFQRAAKLAGVSQEDWDKRLAESYSNEPKYDPVVALYDEYKAAEKAYNEAPNDEEIDKIHDEFEAANLAFLNQPPTTIQGAVLKPKELTEVDFNYKYGGAIPQQFDQVIEFLSAD